MSYTVEEIFYFHGQFDQVFTLFLKQGTESYEKYGRFVTGLAVYTKKQRDALQLSINQIPMPKTFDKVRLRVYSEDISDDRKKDLLKNGLESSDVARLLALNVQRENEYTKEGVKKLPKPIEVPFNSTGIDEDDFMINVLASMEKDGFKLCPFEKDEAKGAAFRQLEKHVSRERFDELLDVVRKNPTMDRTRYYFLKEKLLRGTISEEEQIEFDDVRKTEIDRRLSVLRAELQKSTENPKKLANADRNNLMKLARITVFFDPIRLTHSKVPVWFDYDRFIHIYIRHVAETTVGERFAARSNFRYAFEEVRNLIENVLRSQEDEIDKHFEERPNDNFKRHGEKAVYYKGDFYVINVAPTGELMDFYRVGKNENA